MRYQEHIVMKFITENFDAGTAPVFNDEKFRPFLTLVEENKEIAAAKEYEDVTGASLEECHFVVTFVKKVAPIPR